MDDREAYEARYLLDGRRVQISDLLAADLLQPGQTLEWELKRKAAVHVARVEPNGTLRLTDGQVFRTPSRAAAVAAGVGAVDGWHAWRLPETGESLDQLRGKLLDREVWDGARLEQLPTTDTRRRRFEFLRGARAQAESGEHVDLTVRDLLRWWNASSRGTRISARVEADLANHGLESWPDFRKVAIDTPIELRALSDPEEAEDVGTNDVLEESGGSGNGPTAVVKGPDDPDDDGGTDSGITVGNLPAALSGVVAVAPDAGFERAITLMLINDFSQLAVLNGRRLRGAVTWRSIAQARNADANAQFADAVVEAKSVDYDTELATCLQLLEEDDFFFVLDQTRQVSGIVTATDVVKLYGQLATPFLLIGDLDRALRRVMSRKFTIDEIRGVADTDGTRDIRTYDDLTFGDYQQVLGNPELWSRLGWALDRRTVAARLDELREFRNDVMHFNPDPVPPAMVSNLRHFISVVRSYCD